MFIDKGIGCPAVLPETSIKAPPQIQKSKPTVKTEMTPQDKVDIKPDESREEAFKVLVDAETEETIDRGCKTIDAQLQIISPEELDLIVNGVTVTQGNTKLDDVQKSDTDSISEIDKKTIESLASVKRSNKTEKDQITELFKVSYLSDKRDKIINFLDKISEEDRLSGEFQGITGQKGTSYLVGTGEGGHYVNSILTSLIKLNETGRLTPAVLDNLIKLKTASPLCEDLKDDRLSLIRSVLQDIAFPEKINQHGKGTCSATSVQILLATDNPAQYINLVSELASPEGKAKSTLIGAERMPNSLTDDCSGRSITGRLLQPAFMEYGRTHSMTLINAVYDNKNDVFFNMDNTINIPSSNPHILKHLESAVGPSVFAELTTPSGIKSTPVIGTAFKTLSELKTHTQIIVDTIRPPLSKKEKENIIDAVIKHSQFIETGLSDTSQEKVLQGLGYSTSHFFSAHMTPALTATGPVPASLRWADGGHAVLLTKIEGKNAYFMNPWGELHSMPLAEFQSRLTGITLINGKSISLTGDSSAYGKYNTISPYSYQTTADMLSKFATSSLYGTLNTKCSSLPVSNYAFASFLPIADKSNPTLLASLNGAISSITDTKKLNAFLFVVGEASKYLSDTNLNAFITSNSIDVINSYTSSMINLNKLEKEKYITRSESTAAFSDPTLLQKYQTFSEILSNGNPLAKSGIVPEYSIASLKRDLTTKSPKELETIKDLYKNMLDTAKTGFNLTAKHPDIKKATIVEQLKNVKNVEEAMFLKNLYTGLEKGIITESDFKTLQSDIIDSASNKIKSTKLVDIQNFNKKLNSALKCLEESALIGNAAILDPAAIKQEAIDLMKHPTYDAAKQISEFKILEPKYQAIGANYLQLKDYSMLGLLSDAKTKTLISAPLSPELKPALESAYTALKSGMATAAEIQADFDGASTLVDLKAKYDKRELVYQLNKVAVKAAWDQGYELIKEGLASSAEVESKIRDKIKALDPVSDAVKITTDLNALKTEFLSTKNAFTDINTKVIGLRIAAAPLIQNGLLSTEELDKSIKDILAQGKPKVENEAKIDKLKTIMTESIALYSKAKLAIENNKLTDLKVMFSKSDLRNQPQTLIDIKEAMQHLDRVAEELKTDIKTTVSNCVSSVVTQTVLVALENPLKNYDLKKVFGSGFSVNGTIDTISQKLLELQSQQLKISSAPSSSKDPFAWLSDKNSSNPSTTGIEKQQFIKDIDKTFEVIRKYWK